MFDMIYPIAAMVLVSASALAGAVISFFTRLEMETYRKHINVLQNLAGILLLIFVAVMTFNAVYLIALAAGLVLGRVISVKESIWMEWALLGALAGSIFAYNITLGFLTAAFIIVFAFIKATELNIPLVLKKKKFMKTRIFEQAVFLASAAAVYLGIVALGYAGAGVLYVAMGALAWIFWKEAVISYF